MGLIAAIPSDLCNQSRLGDTFANLKVGWVTLLAPTVSAAVIASAAFSPHEGGGKQSKLRALDCFVAPAALLRNDGATALHLSALLLFSMISSRAAMKILASSGGVSSTRYALRGSW